jgi:RNA methyltransferase, TrmH family
MKRITSRQNALVATYRAVARGAEPGLMLLDGLHLVADAAAAGLRIRHVMIAGDAVDRRDIQTLIARLEPNGADTAAGSAPVMAAVSPVRSSSSIVAIAERPVHPGDRLFTGPAPLVLIACDVQDPGNVGAIARVSLPIGVRASADQTVTEARQRRCRIVAAVPRGGRSMVDADLRGPVAIFVGGEGRGLAPSVVDKADQHVTIPMRPPVESLNTAVTAALLVYEARRQRLEPASP